MPTTKQNPLPYYALAVAGVIVTTIVRLQLQEITGSGTPFLLFALPVLVAAWFGGLGPGLLATALSLLSIGFYFLPPYGTISLDDPTNLWWLTAFLVEGLIISLLGEARLRGESVLRTAQDWLESSVRQRTSELSIANEHLAEQIAEREQAQAALLESEERFRSVAQNASDAIVLSDSEGRITFWNQAAQIMFGYTTDEVIGQMLTILMPADLQDAHKAGLHRLKQGGGPRLLGKTVEVRGLRKDGTEFPAELSLASWQFGGQTFHSGILRDITARKEAEDERVRLAAELAKHAEAQIAEQRYHLLAEAIPQIVWTGTPDGALDYYNPRWFEYTGMTLEQTLGWGWQPVVHPDDLQECLDRWTQAVATGDNYEVEYRFKRHDGVYRWHLGRAVPVRDGQGQIIKWFGTSTDIDDQKRSQAASGFLAQTGARLAAQLDETAIVRTLARQCVPAVADWCFVDLAVGEDPSYSEPHLPALRRAAQSGPRALPPEDASLFQLRPNESATPRGPWLALCAHRSDISEVMAPSTLASLTQPGSPLEVLRDEPVRALACVPLMARGRALGVLTLAFADSGKQPGPIEIGMIEDLARSAAFMVDNARLLHQLQQSNTSKDEFLAVLSHELRTPLTAILGWVQLLSTGRLDAETQARAMQTIDRNTRAQTRMIEDLLDLSRIISGKLRLDSAPLEIIPLVESAVETIRPAARDKELELFVVLENEGSIVKGDAHRLQQVLGNLLSNALKFTPRGGRIEVIAQREEPVIEISVRDTGQGIAPEFLPHVFDRFRQADSSSTRRYGGLGLGLAIVRHLVELHGGSVHVVSPGEGQGTTFTVRLPLALSNSIAAPEPQSNGGASTRDNLTELLRGVRVLVVDDEPDARDMLSAALTRYGAQVKACGSVREALHELPNWKPGVLVSDIGMPQEDGYDLIRQVRAMPSQDGGQVPAMALTAYARSSDRDRALDAGFNRHVSKPVDPSTLANVVAELARATTNGS